jgi:hypothetical protein
MKSDLTPYFEFPAILTLHLVLDDVVPYLKPVFRRLLLEDVGSAVRTWTQCYKTFYGRNLRIFIISYSAFPRQRCIMFASKARASLLEYLFVVGLYSQSNVRKARSLLQSGVPALG